MDLESMVRLGKRMGAEKGKDIADRIPAESRVGRVMQTSTVLAAVTIGVIAVIGIYIFDQVYTTMPNPSNSDLNASTQTIAGGFGNAIEFVPVVLIVLMAAVVIAVVQRFRS